MDRYDVIVIGGGHAGAEAAWAAANLLPVDGRDARPTVALVTIERSKIGVMSCNPAIGGLAKGQLVREVDAMGGLMGLAADAAGIQFKVLNTSKGEAVHGPRAQCDKHAYAEAVQRLLASRPEIEVVEGTVEELLVERVPGSTRRRIAGVRIARRSAPGTQGRAPSASEGILELRAGAVVLTTGTFMRGLMHTGETRTPGGRVGESAAVGISHALEELGFELGRLKTGTPPRLRKGTIDWESLPLHAGDSEPRPFSELSNGTFPPMPQVDCRQTQTTPESHELIRTNLHRAPMYSGTIDSVGPRYCPSIEDKVVRFGERESHGVFLEPESLRDDWVYCNGISTSLPTDVQDAIVHAMPGCAHAEVLRYGYAVEYDMVRPHQILATGMTRLVEGLFLAGQINGTSGYEEAAGQGLVAGVNAARLVEPYRMFTSRAEHRLLLRADNAPDRLTACAIGLGLLDSTERGRERRARFERRQSEMDSLRARVAGAKAEGQPLDRTIRRPGFGPTDLARHLDLGGLSASSVRSVIADVRYAPYIERARAEVRRRAELEHRRIPDGVDYERLGSLRNEAREALGRFRPATFGQAGRLEGVTPADLMLLSVLVGRSGAGGSR